MSLLSPHVSVAKSLVSILIFVCAMTYVFLKPEAESNPKQTPSAAPPLELRIANGEKPEFVALVQGAWPAVRAHCPGLDRFAADLTYQGLDDYTMVDLDPPVRRVDVVFKVANHPTTLPPGLSRARGHTCRWGVSPDGDALIIMKDECISVCLNRLYESRGQNYRVSI